MCNTNTPEEDFEMQQIEKNNGDNLIFGDADKCKEWPCVNDEVIYKDATWKVVALYKHVALLAHDDVIFEVAGVDSLKRPKTPN